MFVCDGPLDPRSICNRERRDRRTSYPSRIREEIPCCRQHTNIIANFHLGMGNCYVVSVATQEEMSRAEQHRNKAAIESTGLAKEIPEHHRSNVPPASIFGVGVWMKERCKRWECHVPPNARRQRLADQVGTRGSVCNVGCSLHVKDLARVVVLV